jgi:phytanoyl-CoA hydroxylase
MLATSARREGHPVELHPWNTGFEWADGRAPFRRLSIDQAAQFDELGFVVLEHVFTDEELAPVIAATDALEAKSDRFLAGLEGERFSIAERGAITFALYPVLADEAARRFAAHPVFLDLCHDLIGPDVRLYHDQAVYKKPEKPRRFPWHQDNGYNFVEPQQYLTCWVALTDATELNGCPQVVPGLHRLGTLRHHFNDPLGWEIFENHPDAVAAPVSKGGVVVFSSLSPHLTGPNTTDQVRKAYILQYAPDGARVLQGDSAAPATGTVLANDPDRQFAVLVRGEPAATPHRSAVTSMTAEEATGFHH